MLDIVVGNSDEPNQLLFWSACPDGGAQIQSHSWCFHCPDYMGHPLFLNNERPVCLECMPDHMPEEGTGEKCSSIRCTLGERPLGTDVCTNCQNGTFYNNTLERNLANSPGHHSNTGKVYHFQKIGSRWKYKNSLTNSFWAQCR